VLFCTSSTVGLDLRSLFLSLILGVDLSLILGVDMCSLFYKFNSGSGPELSFLSSILGVDLSLILGVDMCALLYKFNSGSGPELSFFEFDSRSGPEFDSRSGHVHYFLQVQFWEWTWALFFLVRFPEWA